MTRPPQPRHITLGGHEAVALTPQEYERLIVSRRQVGGQSARVRVLAQRVKQSEELLRQIEALIGQSEDGCPGPHMSAGRGVGSCLRCELATLLQRHRNGRGADAPSGRSAPRGA
ncbi:hypothetical protein ABZV77_10045 [Streptomyces sp. NPDC004732]|uniref:hypothetical protein n=1 Tax=Streptomyces sp. NPDC004732 TaxID=3154290 RepID=UPI00339E092E